MTLMLKKHDRVRLKTGGPVLFVEGVHSNRRLLCSWMDGMGQRHEAPFLLEDLEKIGPFSLDEFESEEESDTADDNEDHGDGSPGNVSHLVGTQQRRGELGHTLHMIVSACVAWISVSIPRRRQKSLAAQ